MIRNLFYSQGKLSGSIWWLLACVASLCSAHMARATAPDVNQLLAKAEQGFVSQEIQLAQAYFTGDGVAQNPVLAAHWYEKAAASGNPEAQNLVGYFYEAGVGVQADPVRAMHWYQLAAASGLPDATLNIGVLYALGRGVKKDEAYAAQCFQQAVKKGDGTGAAYLGTMSYLGLGMKKDAEAAERWFVLGQKMHDPVSTYDLGALYSVSPDHRHDPAKAAGLMRQSSEAGYVPAIHSLALLLIHYPGLARSPQEALTLAQSGANAGYWRSSMLLGIMARDGVSVPADDKAAYYHFQVAILQGGNRVQSLLDADMKKLTNRLGTQQATELDSQAKLWFQQRHLSDNFVHIKGKQHLPVPDSSDPADILRANLPSSDPAS